MEDHPLSPNLGKFVGGGDFPPVDYLEWYVPRLQAGVTHDLTQSGFHYSWDWEELAGGIVLADLTNPYTGKPLDPRQWVADREGAKPTQVAGGHGVSQSLVFALLSV